MEFDVGGRIRNCKSLWLGGAFASGDNVLVQSTNSFSLDWHWGLPIGSVVPVMFLSADLVIFPSTLLSMEIEHGPCHGCCVSL